jgi:hypothetical protein
MKAIIASCVAAFWVIGSLGVIVLTAPGQGPAVLYVLGSLVLMFLSHWAAFALSDRLAGNQTNKAHADEITRRDNHLGLQLAVITQIVGTAPSEERARIEQLDQFKKWQAYAHD